MKKTSKSEEKSKRKRKKASKRKRGKIRVRVYKKKSRRKRKKEREKKGEEERGRPVFFTSVYHVTEDLFRPVTSLRRRLAYTCRKSNVQSPKNKNKTHPEPQ